MTTLTHTHTRTPARRALLAAAVSMVGLGAAAPREAAQAQAAPGLVDLQVIDRDTGQTARVWRNAGRLYVAGQPGARYSLRVTNNSGARVLAVMSVDGVNILTGETAAYDQRGYVFAPYETYDVKGWRKSQTEIAAFNFAPLAGSYAARTGRPGDVGVIGVAAFRERAVAAIPVSPATVEAQRRREDIVVTGGSIRRPPTDDVAPPPPLAIPPVQRRSEAPAGPASAAPQSSAALAMAESSVVRPAPLQPGAKLGTGHGAREWSTIRTVAFERATSAPQFVYRLEYDSRERLMASGVIPRPRPTSPSPRPFPGAGYVPDPPSYGG